MKGPLLNSREGPKSVEWIRNNWDQIMAIDNAPTNGWSIYDNSFKKNNGVPFEGNQVNYKNLRILYNIKHGIYILYFKPRIFKYFTCAQLSKPFLKASSLLVSSPFVGNNQPPSVFSFHA